MLSVFADIIKLWLLRQFTREIYHRYNMTSRLWSQNNLIVKFLKQLKLSYIPYATLFTFIHFWLFFVFNIINIFYKISVLPCNLMILLHQH